jgi:hypothetical protein
MENGDVLAEVVRAWVGLELPGDRGAADRAAHIAESSFNSGATIDEACSDAASFIGSWVRHPSHWRAASDGMVALAS